MPKNTLDREIKSSIASFVEELTVLVKQATVESVREALGGASSSKRRGPGRPRKATSKRGKRIRRSASTLDATAAKILSHIKANPGSGVTEIAASLRTTSKNLRLPILKLLEEKKLRTTGQRRGMKYHAVRAGGSPKNAKRSKKKAKRKATKKTRAARKAKAKKKTKKRSRKAA